MQNMKVTLSIIWIAVMLTYLLGDVLRIIVAIFWFLFNLVGLPTYQGHYDKFLLAVSMVFNVVTIWFAWKWV